MKKKIGIGLFILGIVMILIPLLFPSNTSKQVKHISEWEYVTSNDNSINKLLVNKDINCNCESYNSSEYSEEYIYSDSSNNYKLSFLVPSQLELERVEFFITDYTGEMTIRYATKGADTFDEYLKNYILEYESNFKKFYIRKKTIDDDSFAVLTKAVSEDNKNYLEELVIMSINDDSYSTISYLVLNRSLSNEFVDTIINGFKREDNKAKYTNCNEKDNQYVCSININKIKKMINFNVDKNKYKLMVEPRINNYEESFEGLDEKSIIVSFFMVENIKERIDNSKWLDKYKYDDVVIEGKTVQKYYINGEERNRAYYMFQLDDEVVLVLNTFSSIDNLDEIAKDFINVELVDMK